jgi:hypothetical protein
MAADPSVPMNDCVAPELGSIVAPPDVPSVTQGSTPWTPSFAVKKTFPPTRTNEEGLELAAAPMNELAIGIIFGRANAGRGTESINARKRTVLGRMGPSLVTDCLPGEFYLPSG